MRPARASYVLLPVLAAAAALLSACGSLPSVHGPSALTQSTCAPRNDAVKNGEFVVCMNGGR